VASSRADCGREFLWRAELSDRAFKRIVQVCDGGLAAVWFNVCSHAAAQ
jgi:hypothetical protein